MIGLAYPLVRRWLFNRDAEWSHDITLYYLGKVGRSWLAPLLYQPVAKKPVQLMGITFPNPVGLAAGLDKNATCIDALSRMGFGFIEVGTVTPVGQEGNPKPRMFRLPEANAIINRMGFNNEGLETFIENVQASNYQGVLGINIGKNKDTPEEEGPEDFRKCLEAVYPYASYVTVNISSPNTPGLRDMQHGKQLELLLDTLKQEQKKQHRLTKRYVPLVVKIAPDLAQEAVEAVVQLLLDFDIDGMIATNTTLERDAVAHLEHGDEAGGLSGHPVREKSLDVIRWARAKAGPEFPIIGVGGIDDAVSAQAKIDAGAQLVQVYTGFIYQGPKLIRDIVKQVRF